MKKSRFGIVLGLAILHVAPSGESQGSVESGDLRDGKVAIVGVTGKGIGEVFEAKLERVSNGRSPLKLGINEGFVRVLEIDGRPVEKDLFLNFKTRWKDGKIPAVGAAFSVVCYEGAEWHGMPPEAEKIIRSKYGIFGQKGKWGFYPWIYQIESVSQKTISTLEGPTRPKSASTLEVTSPAETPSQSDQTQDKQTRSTPSMP